MDDQEEPRIPVAETVHEDTAATLDGAVIGEVDGLLWHDASGVDIVSVTIDVGQIAVPVDHNEWRGGGAVELAYDEIRLEGAPLLDHLTKLSADQAIEEIGDHYALNLGGPPPGPDPQPLPPWWDPGDSGD